MYAASCSRWLRETNAGWAGAGAGEEGAAASVCTARLGCARDARVHADAARATDAAARTIAVRAERAVSERDGRAGRSEATTAECSLRRLSGRLATRQKVHRVLSHCSGLAKLPQEREGGCFLRASESRERRTGLGMGAF